MIKIQWQKINEKGEQANLFIYRRYENGDEVRGTAYRHGLRLMAAINPVGGYRAALISDRVGTSPPRQLIKSDFDSLQSAKNWAEAECINFSGAEPAYEVGGKKMVPYELGIGTGGVLHKY